MNNNIRICVTAGEEQFEIQGDSSISFLSTLQNNKIYIDAPCNGNGKCGKCKAVIRGEVSPVTEVETKILTEQELNNGVRLACKTYPLGESSISIINNDSMGVKSSGKMEEKYNLSPIVDVTEREKAYGLAVDIGTTTVASYFYDLKTGGKIKTVSGLNEQRSFGADVISRMNTCITDQNGLALLQKTIVAELNNFIAKFEQDGYDSQDIVDVTIAANTVMLHMFAGLSPNGIAVAPFTPTSLFGFNVKASEVGQGLNVNKEANVYLSDCISGYVGGDITAGMLSSSIYDNKSNVIYIDIGTNGEMAVGNDDGFVCCATAAGPAFEGAHIKHGVGGISGAISKVYVEDGDIKFETINNVPPVGICGSGLIDAIATMIKLGVIDETGRIDEDEIPENLMYRYFEDDEPEFYIDMQSKISITQKDVREIQLAKAAILAGIKTMLNSKNLEFSDIDQLVLAGGFGSFINKDSACEIGLLPKELIDRIDVVGNAAGMGAIVLLLSKDSRDIVKTIFNKTEYYELSGDSFFQDQYIEEMMF